MFKHLNVSGVSYFACRAVLFCDKMGPFFGGVPPAVVPEGDLVFRGKAELPSYFIDLLIFTSRLPTGVLGM
jgi:hypothetical protein